MPEIFWYTGDLESSSTAASHSLRFSKFSSITIGYYCAPPLWMNIASYKWQGYGNGPSMAYVYSVFAIVIGACTILSYLGIRKKDLNFVEEI